jgi:hypothetical protein
MKLSELIPPVEGINMVVLLDEGQGEPSYYVYLVNNKPDIIEGIIVTSVGYGEDLKTGENVKTSVLRHSLEVMLPGELAKIEMISPEVFNLYNEFWVSFWLEEILYDKKFVFAPRTILTENLTYLKQFEKKGIML